MCIANTGARKNDFFSFGVHPVGLARERIINRLVTSFYVLR